jgi:hypothetical protein
VMRRFRDARCAAVRKMTDTPSIKSGIYRGAGAHFAQQQSWPARVGDGVISGHCNQPDRSPLYPPKADMDQHGRDVRFVPKADIDEAMGNGSATDRLESQVQSH